MHSTLCSRAHAARCWWPDPLRLHWHRVLQPSAAGGLTIDSIVVSVAAAAHHRATRSTHTHLSFQPLQGSNARHGSAASCLPARWRPRRQRGCTRRDTNTSCGSIRCAVRSSHARLDSGASPVAVVAEVDGRDFARAVAAAAAELAGAGEHRLRASTCGGRRACGACHAGPGQCQAGAAGRRRWGLVVAAAAACQGCWTGQAL